jgi:sugar phosphate isomerase/epimerase
MEPLRLGFTTYSMPDLDPFDVVPGLADIGYDAIEITASAGYATSHENLDAGERSRLRTLLQTEGFTPPVVMDLVPVCSTGETRRGMLDRVHRTCELVADLHWGDGDPVFKSPIVGDQPEWEGNEERILRDIQEVANVAAEHGVTYATEVHVRTALDTVEKVRWLLEHNDHPNLALNFDVSHFPREQFDVAEAIEVCGPHAVTTHVKDAELVDGDVRFRLPGETDFPYEWCFRRLLQTGYRGAIVAEVSAQLWRAPDFDGWAAARTCYENLEGPVAAANEAFADGSGDGST